MGEIAGGNWLSWMISIDAILVLSGAVLTSYVGVNGLVRRMTLDRCLPQFLLKTNSSGNDSPHHHRLFCAGRLGLDHHEWRHRSARRAFIFCPSCP